MSALFLSFNALLFLMSSVYSIPIGDGQESSPQMLPQSRSWHCGSGWVTKIFSFALIVRGCSKLTGDANQCCYEHDQCYDKQRGQENCDNSFCDCLAVAFRDSETCSTHGRNFCRTVRVHGQSSYDAGHKP